MLISTACEWKWSIGKGKRISMRFMPMLALITLFSPVPAALAQSLKSDEVLSSIAIQAIAEPDPVLGADGRVHLAYELMVTKSLQAFRYP
jgi:hypothetical protein